MDIYGYPAYQYNQCQSDELAKQMFAQQALSSSMPYNREVPEPHIMPAPTGAPWNPQSLPWGTQSPPQLVQFTATPVQDQKITPVIHCKRKSLDVEPPIPAKQLITEEKMAAHLNSLHISSEYTPHTLAQESMDLSMDQPSPTPDLCEKLKGHRIVLSEEVKKLKDEPLLPASLIERLEKPRMSLVVWKPKEDILKELKEEKEDEINEEMTPRRNGVLVPDMSRMDVEM